MEPPKSSQKGTGSYLPPNDKVPASLTRSELPEESEKSDPDSMAPATTA